MTARQHDRDGCAQCDCGAPTEGKWAGKHSVGCASLAEPTAAEIARIIGCAPDGMGDPGCDASCQTDGGTCICEELHATAALAIIARFRSARP